MIIEDVERYGVEVLEQLPLSLDDRITMMYRQLVGEGVPSELICSIANRTAAAEPADWNEIRRHWRDVGSTALQALERSGLFVVDRVSEILQVRVVHARIAEALKDICQTD